MSEMPANQKEEFNKQEMKKWIHAKLHGDQLWKVT